MSVSTQLQMSADEWEPEQEGRREEGGRRRGVDESPPVLTHSPRARSPSTDHSQHTTHAAAALVEEPDRSIQA